MTKILLGSRHGGHATRTHLVKKCVEEEFENPEYFVLTDYQDEHNYDEKIFRADSWRETQGRYRPIKAAKNLYKSLKVILKEKPDAVVAYGANTSFFSGVIGRLLGKKVVAIESENRTQEPSMSPNLLSLIGAEVWVSHDQMLDQYFGDKVKNKGLIQRRSYEEYESDEKENDTLVVPSTNDQEIMEKHWEHIPHEELLEKMGKTETVITRAGMTAYEAAHLADKVKVIPYNHIHQKNFAEWLEKEYENVEIEKEKAFKQLFEENQL